MTGWQITDDAKQVRLQHCLRTLNLPDATISTFCKREAIACQRHSNEEDCPVATKEIITARQLLVGLR